jgi:hypothetical protein
MRTDSAILKQRDNARCRAYYRKHRERLLAATKLWANSHSEYRKEYNKKYWAALSPDKKQQQKDRLLAYYRDVTRKAFELYGSKCSRCGFSDWRALQLDHTNGNGRKLKEQRGAKLCAEILAGKHDKGKIQLLCANCNWIKRSELGEGCKPRNNSNIQRFS